MAKNKIIDSVWVVPYCEQTKRFMIARRANKGKGTWNLFGGGVDKGEKLIKAAMREFREEAGVKLNREMLVYVKSVKIGAADGVIKRMHFFMFRSEYEFAPKMNPENDKYRWIKGTPPLALHKSLGVYLSLVHKKTLAKLSKESELFNNPKFKPVNKPSETAVFDAGGSFQITKSGPADRLSIMCREQVAACVDYLPGSNRLINFYVNPQWRNAGFDVALLEKATDEFAVKDMVTPITNEKFLSFFKAVGFVPSEKTAFGSVMEYLK